MKFTTLFSFFLLFLFSCEENNTPENTSELYQVTISSDLDILNVMESGRIDSDSSSADSIAITDIYYQLHDSDCNEIDSDGRMIYDGSIPSIVLPNIEAGEYYYYISASGNNGIRYDTASSFTLESDTSIVAVLQNKQMRYRFNETSSFTSNEVYRVSYQLNYTNEHIYRYSECTENGFWNINDYDSYVDETSYSAPFSTAFNFNNPIDIESVHIKFYDTNENVLKSHIIPIAKELKYNHSYTFNVDLSAIWSDESSENSIQISIESIDWNEETVDLNG